MHPNRTRGQAAPSSTWAIGGNGSRRRDSRSPLEAVMSHEVWEEYYDRLTQLIEAHKTTLVFVNTRRMAERVARHLSDRLGDTAVTAHHGSLSKEKRLDAETRLKTGQLKSTGRDGVARARHRHRSRRSRLPDWVAASHCHAAPAGRPLRPQHLRPAEGSRVSRLARRSLRMRGTAARQSAAASSIASCRTMRRSMCSRNRSSPRRRAANTAEDELFALVRRAWPYRDLQRGRLRRGLEDDRGRLLDQTRTPRALLCIATK